MSSKSVYVNDYAKKQSLLIVLIKNFSVRFYEWNVSEWQLVNASQIPVRLYHSKPQ